MPDTSLRELGNNLLTWLKPQDLALLTPHLQDGHVVSGQILYEPGDVVQRVYFPCGPTLLAFRVVFEDGRAVETALVGREGAMSGIVSQGRLPAYSRAEVRFGGPILHMPLTQLEAAKLQSLAIRHHFARYADCLMAQVFQSVACNASHSIEQRTARWLMSALDRTSDPRLPITQDQLAHMLGIGRSYMSRVIQTFKRRGLIETQRGGITIANVEGLAQAACQCQGAIREHFDVVLKGVYPDDPVPDVSNAAE